MDEPRKYDRHGLRFWLRLWLGLWFRFDERRRSVRAAPRRRRRDFVRMALVTDRIRPIASPIANCYYPANLTTGEEVRARSS